MILNKLPRWHSGKESPANAGTPGDVGLIPWRKKWLPIQYSCLGKSSWTEETLIRRYNPWGHKVGHDEHALTHGIKCNP